MNMGDGHLAEPVAYSWPSTISELRLFDMDGDGALDLVFSASKPFSGIVVLKNKGAGTFDTSKSIIGTCEGDPDVFDITDVDRDGRPDVIVKIQLPVTFQGQNTTVAAVDILQQQASGTLSLLAPYSPFVPQYQGATLGLVSSLLAGDLNGDGQSDFAIAFSIGTQIGGQVELSGIILPHYIVGNSINAGQALPLGGGQPIITKGDLNSDGRVDLAGTGLIIDQNTDGSTVNVYLNNGGGSFVTPGQSVPSGARPFDILMTDAKAN